jgi:hypothetical protein
MENLIKLEKNTLITVVSWIIFMAKKSRRNHWKKPYHRKKTNEPKMPIPAQNGQIDSETGRINHRAYFLDICFGSHWKSQTAFVDLGQN